MRRGHGAMVRRFLKCLLLATPLAATTALSAYLLIPQRPRIIFALGQNRGFHLLRPLKQQKTGFFSLLFGEARHENWYGGQLYIEGVCGSCGRPWAEDGAFVLARLPGGLAYATKEQSKHNHLTRPRFISTPRILVGAFGFSLVVLFAPAALLLIRHYRATPPGHCQSCGYDLTGNESGICPECGRPTPATDTGKATSKTT